MSSDDESGIEYYGSKKGKSEVLLGFNSDSEAEIDDSDSEKEGDDSPKDDDKNDPNDETHDTDDDDMFASGDDDSISETKSRKKFDMDEFEREQGIGKYDEEKLIESNDEKFNLVDAEEQRRQQIYYGNIEVLKNDTERPKQEVTIEAFDLREEAEKFEFDKNMNVVRQKDDSQKEEAWLIDVNAADIEKARLAQAKNQAQTKIRPTRCTKELLTDLITALEPSETPLEALSRLAPQKKGRKSKNLLKHLDEKLRKQQVYEITGACDELMNDKGFAKLFDLSREDLMRIYRQETGSDYKFDRGQKRTFDDAEIEDDETVNVIDYGPKIWEFRWKGDDQVNGPYSSYEMNYWKVNYFNDDVMIRKKGESDFRKITAEDFETQASPLD
ncbi:hypothetical_protein [Candidozyma auris]|uniref:U5 snRNP complex subunit LIN1 n=1 Tax=Candidozyma auris TaxID=498019 RepID=UPI000D2B9621|nr:U5 snRNP complex subunit LIN1 [[Candida] auris]QEO19382.1 hypothetical_protein [[Candida] auris]GBL50637.1 hypothetical protein CAJCM15448_29110 [[Candida] auris]